MGISGALAVEGDRCSPTLAYITDCPDRCSLCGLKLRLGSRIYLVAQYRVRDLRAVPTKGAYDGYHTRCLDGAVERGREHMYRGL